MWGCCTHNWFWLARSRCNRILNELQGVSLLDIYSILRLQIDYRLVELIVLNLGLSAGVLDTRTFSMFVVHALLVTIVTTPLVLFFYPERVRVYEDEVVRRKIGPVSEESRYDSTPSSNDGFKSRISIVLTKIEQLPAAFMLSQLVNNIYLTQTLPPVGSTDEKADPLGPSDPIGLSKTSPTHLNASIHINVIRLIELSTGMSAILKFQEASSLLHSDPAVSIFRTFGALHKLNVSASLSVVDSAEYPDAVVRRVQESESQLVILPWSKGSASVHESDSQHSERNPLDGVFHKSNVHVQDQTNSVVYSEFVRGIFLKSPCDVALFVDRGLSDEPGSIEHHLFLPFFGGPDDRLALTLLVQLCRNPLVTAQVVRMVKTEGLKRASIVEEVKAMAVANMTTVGIFLFLPT